MRILQVHTRYRQPGGEDAVVEGEGAILREAGHDVELHEEENPPTAMAAAVDLAAAPWNVAAARRVRHAVRKWHPDVAHVHNTWFAMSPAVLSAIRSEGVPVVMTLHNYRVTCSNGLLFRDGHPCEDCVESHPWHGVRHRCYRSSAVASMAAASTIALHRRRRTWWRDVDLFLTPSDFARERLIAGGVPADRIRTKPNFVPDPGPRSAPPSRSRTMLFVGRVSHEKGVDVLTEAWRKASPEDLALVVIGDGPLLPDLKSRAPTQVRFAGQLPASRVREHLLTARALLFPSLWYETFGLALVEGMAAGLPVLAANHGVARDVAVGALDACLVTPGDVTAWADAVRTLASDELVDQLGKRSRVVFERRFSPAQTIRSLEAAYMQAQEELGRTPRSSATVPEGDGS